MNQVGTSDAVANPVEGRGLCEVSPEVFWMVVQPAPWRVLRMYFWLALAMTAGPLLLGLWSGLVGYLLTSCSPSEIVAQCFELVGYMPLFGLIIVVLSVPAAWVMLADQKRNRWLVDAGGVHVEVDGKRTRDIGWEQIDTIRVGTSGPLIIFKDRSQEGEQLHFVPRPVNVALHKRWSQRA